MEKLNDAKVINYQTNYWEPRNHDGDNNANSEKWFKKLCTTNLTCITLFGRFLAATERLCSEILQASSEEDVNTPRRLFPSFYSFPKISYF